ncbi:MAG: hypothetical protein DI569_14850 [Sphingopyxis macrogoltabida]|uniref:Uncharacterized protein n=1 Tax=Sphingopyxis macrogoltabida TaxID=33050 RepID=A0A2W5KUG5_SPHMC|nr:MAG: hypothetical protein DI569_14850 [Sphingopyxis macrogoltabida]
MTCPAKDRSAAGGCDSIPRPDRPDRPAAVLPPVAGGVEDRRRAAATFVLRYQDRRYGIEKRVTFEAAGLAQALALAEYEPIGDWAELATEAADGQVFLCRRRRRADGRLDYWTAD